MKNLHLLSELHLFHLFCYMRNLPFLIAFSFALIYQRNSVAFTIGIHQLSGHFQPGLFISHIIKKRETFSYM